MVLGNVASQGVVVRMNDEGTNVMDQGVVVRVNNEGMNVMNFD